MRKVKPKRLRQLARQLQSPEIPVKERVLYTQLKDLYRQGHLPKDLKIQG
jgi:DNA-binding HxlR family transcriptional regulator